MTQEKFSLAVMWTSIALVLLVVGLTYKNTQEIIKSYSHQPTCVISQFEYALGFFSSMAAELNCSSYSLEFVNDSYFFCCNLKKNKSIHICISGNSLGKLLNKQLSDNPWLK